MSKKATSHWVWEPYPPVRGSGGATEIAGIESIYEKLVTGERLTTIPRLVVRGRASGRSRDDLGSYTGTHLVSPVLRDVLEDTPSAHLQFLPIRLAEDPDARYFAVNVLDSHPAIDLERSRYDVHEGTDIISRLQKLVLRSIAVDAPPIFHAAEQPAFVFVNKDVHDRLVKASKTPGVLTAAEDYQNTY